MLKQLKEIYYENEVYRFLINLIFLVGLYELAIYIFSIIPGFYYWDLFHLKVIYNGVDIAEWVLSLMGYELGEFDNQQYFQIIGGSVLKAGKPCSGVNLMAYYTIIILAYPGTIKSKMIFIPVGILLIHLVNVGRYVALALSDLYTKEYFELHHHVIFKAVAYILIFIFWLVYVKVNSRAKS